MLIDKEHNFILCNCKPAKNESFKSLFVC